MPSPERSGTERAPLRVLIADDELLARQRLEDLLHGEHDVQIVARATNGIEAVAAIREQRPDLVFLDVQMPGRTGLEVIREIGAERMPATIFTTAYDQYALRAFELAAVDYLVKPFDDERFEQALRRARELVELRELGGLRERLLAVLQDTKPGIAGASGPPNATDGRPRRYLERIAVELRGRVRVVPVDQIEFITASGPYAELHVGDRVHLIRESMQALEERLDPDRFLRVHRSAIVRLDLVDTLHKGAGGDYELQLKGGARVRVSRSRREELERRLGMPHP